MICKRTLALALSTIWIGCGEMADPLETTDAIDSAFTVQLTATEDSGTLRFVNDCATTEVVLDEDARLDARAARAIIAHRDGASAVCGGADANPFDGLFELDATSWVGDRALGKLVAHARKLGYIESNGGTYDGVVFDAAESAVALAIVNSASETFLDKTVDIDLRAARAILAVRPYTATSVAANMTKLASTPYVGRVALTKLKAYAAVWSNCADAAGTYEGVAFTSLEAHDTLDLANAATSVDLERISGIGPVLAGRIAASRPYTDVGALGAVAGVGVSVLTNLRDQVPTRWCSADAASCGCAPAAEAPLPRVPFDENGLYTFLFYGTGPWTPERSIESGFFSHDGTQVVLTDAVVPNDPDNWQQIAVLVFDDLWDCCFRHQFFGDPLEIGPRRRGTLHFGRVINTHDNRPYVMAYWRDIDDASFAWLYEKNVQGAWIRAAEVFLN